MPIIFDDQTPNDRPDSVAWLRFAEDGDGKGVRGALFETTAQGEPLSFCFSRVDRLGNSGGNALSSLTKSLFRSTPGSPTLILCRADEVPAGAFVSDLYIRLPFYRITPTGPEYTGPPIDDRAARRIIDELSAQDNPYEPFERVSKGLDEAFADKSVDALTSDSGLTTVVNLHSFPESLQRPSHSRAAAARQAVQTPSRKEPRIKTLSERLWLVLAGPGMLYRPGDDTGAQYDGDDRTKRNGSLGEPRPDHRKWRELEPDPGMEWPEDGLRPFQKEGVGALIDMNQLLLADDMGLGKTVQAIAALRILKAAGKLGPCLVVAPASLLDQWRREMWKWAPEISAIIIYGSANDRSWQWKADKDVTIVSYEVLRSDFRDPNLPVSQKTWDVVIADEAQRAKNRNDTSDALKGLKRVRSWALTGTPIENHEEELASIMEFVDYDDQQPRRRYHPGRMLMDRHKELQVRRKKSEVLDQLPPKQVTKLTIDLHPKQRASYDKAEQDGIVHLKELGRNVTVTHVLELITRLKQICNVDPETGQSSKLEDIKNRMEELTAQGHKALVFSQYTNEVSGVAAAARYLQEFSPLILTGETPLRDRPAVIDRFKTHGEHKVMVMSLRAGGLGLNLQEASYVFHLDRWWNPAVERQAEDRSHRMGQTVKVNVIKYSCNGTIEESIDRILERKQGLFDNLIDDVSLDLSSRMNREELLGLFGLG